jgi:hypothetical protein
MLWCTTVPGAGVQEDVVAQGGIRVASYFIQWGYQTMQNWE